MNIHEADGILFMLFPSLYNMTVCPPNSCQWYSTDTTV